MTRYRRTGEQNDQNRNGQAADHAHGMYGYGHGPNCVRKIA